jgi:fibronectin type 3 domain-containing protein
VPEVASSIDRELVEEFQFVDTVRSLFKAAGLFVAYWEGYCLAQSNRSVFRRLIEKASGPGAPAVPNIPTEILEALRTLRDRGAPIVAKLRRLASRPGSPEESELLEMSFAVLVGADRGREAVGRWVNDPVGCAQEAGERIQTVMRKLEPLRQVLRPAPVPPATPPTAPSGRAPDDSSEVKPAPTVNPAAAPPPPPPSVVEAKTVVEKPPSAVPAEILVSTPAVPTGLTATPGKGRITVAWNAAAGASRYSVKRSEAVGAPFRVIATATECTYVDGQVAAGIQYFYIVSGSNQAGEGGDSAPAQAMLPAPPAAPSGLTAGAALGRVSLTWTPVPGATIYRVKRSAPGGGPFAILASLEGTSFVDESVQPATSYLYAVAAAGPAGDGPDSALVAAAVPAPPPAAPTGLQASAGNARVALKWDAVADATGYVIRRAAGGGVAPAPVARAAGTTHTDTSVANGTSYSYVVQATNANGESAPSAPATATPVAPPAAPTGFAVTSDNKRLWLNWSPVPGATFYSLKRSTAPGGPYDAIIAGVKQIRQEDIPPSRGTKYYYVVSATGPGGEGPNSAEVSKALQPPPPAPTGLTASSGHARIFLTWTASAGATRYQVKRRVGATAKYVTIASPTDPSHADTTVSHGTTYEYVVSATNGDAESPNSSAVKAEPMAAPSAPTGLAAVAGDAMVTLSWSPAAGAAEYRVQRTSLKEGIFAEIGKVAGTPSYVDSSVTNGTTYDYAIVAVNAGGQSPPSIRARATPLPAPPAPRSLEGSAGESRVLLTWAAAAGAASYSIRRATSPDGPYSEIASIVSTTFTDRSVVTGTTYYYKVSAANAGGSSADAGPVQATPMEQPATPAGLAVFAGVHEVRLTWEASPGAANYTVKRATAPGGPFTTAAVVPGTSHVDKDVDFRSTYYYTVSAMNAAGRSAPSEPAKVSPLPPS